MIFFILFLYYSRIFLVLFLNFSYYSYIFLVLFLYFHDFFHFFIFQYKLRFRAFDSLHDGYTVVKIIIKDVNDLPPKFTQDTYETTILEEDNFGLPKYILPVQSKHEKHSYENSLCTFASFQSSNILSKF